MKIKRKVDASGRTTIEPDTAFELLLRGHDLNGVLVEDVNGAVTQYNEWVNHFDKAAKIVVPGEQTVSPQEEHAKRSATWFVADDMLAVDVREFLLSMCNDAVQYDRVNMEMDMFEERGLIPLLQLMMFLVDHFRRNNVVWGVGRGSSVGSFCLYLIGVHKIDPIKYGLDIHEFLK